MTVATTQLESVTTSAGSVPCGRPPLVWLSCVLLLMICGCDGVQSALDPAGRGAERLAELFWWMAGGAAIIWIGVVALGIYAIRVPRGEHSRRTGVMIIGGGAVFPTVVLTGLLVYGLALLPDLVAPAPEGSLTITVTGEQWWWRVRYERPDGQSVELANEIRLPVNEPVQFRLHSTDVIHAFWIPPLGGKMDMIPGRETRLALYPTRTGVFRGACAEYCGESHALMSFDVVVQEPEEFTAWLERQAQPAETPDSPLAERGQAVFLASGCGACHTVRGTPANGVLGPDLTHVGGRRTIGAATLPSEPEHFARWIAETKAVKPGVLMPEFGMLPADDIRALAAFLDGLK